LRSSLIRYGPNSSPIQILSPIGWIDSRSKSAPVRYRFSVLSFTMRNGTFLSGSCRNVVCITSTAPVVQFGRMR
jgi:hypothetical protein